MSEHRLIGPPFRRDQPAGFDPRSLRDLDEPVRRYLTHALSPGASLEPGMRLWMTGRIKVRAWLPFRAVWEGDGRSLTWRAVVGPGGRPLLRVIDRFAGGAGSMNVRLLGRFAVVDAAGDDVDRSAAGRTAVEAIWAPASLLPDRGVSWRAEADDLIVATWDLPPERPEVRIRVAADGAMRSSCVMRWDDGEHGRHGYIPCGGDAHEEQRFGDVVIPSRLTAGWWHGTPRYDPFFEAEIHAAQPVAASSR
ncbi:MAG TPA: DUF6544 family protein [Solirubrobacteraceae bacterium]|nr:DUF6544 family protein [Solirubrobacteraceae bacterium]